MFLDVLYGGEGNDHITSNVGNDVVDGENGNDILYGGVGDDRTAGGLGSDSLAGRTAATGSMADPVMTAPSRAAPATTCFRRSA